MKLSEIQVSGFGIWRDLELSELSDRTTLFYGPNEAGKTTLMQFIRSVLYGFSDERRQRYLPPVRGGKPGGALVVESAEGTQRIERFAINGQSESRIRVTAADGTQLGAQGLETLLGSLDESIFNNVFAVGLREIQELGTLSDTDAARLLFDLTTGHDRVSLIEVIRELHASRLRLLAEGDSPSEIQSLWQQRESLRARVSELSGGWSRYQKLGRQIDDLAQRAEKLGTEKEAIAKQLSRLKTADRLQEQWQQRRQIVQEIQSLGAIAQIPENALAWLDQTNQKIKRGRAQAKRFDEQLKRLRHDVEKSKFNALLWKQRERIEALSDQVSWIASVRANCTQLETEINSLSARCEPQQGWFTGGDVTAQQPPSPQELSSLRGPARAVRETRRLVQESQKRVETNQSQATGLADEIKATLSQNGVGNLASALETKGEHVARLRRCIQLDSRLEQMKRHHAELEEESLELFDRQVLPLWIVGALGGVFVFGVVMILAGLVFSTSVVGGLGWALAVLGIAGVAATVGGKFMLERAAEREQESCLRQTEMLQKQTEQATEERQELAEQLKGSSGGGPLTTRLKAAEEELRQLESILPRDAERQMSHDETRLAREQHQRAEQRYDEAKSAWRRALTEAGLSPQLKPRDVAEFARRGGDLLHERERLVQLRGDQQQRQAELNTFENRVAQIQRAVEPESIDISLLAAEDRVRQWAQALKPQRQLARRRQQARRRWQQLHRRQRKAKLQLRRLIENRKARLVQFGVETEEDFRQIAASHARYQELVQKQHALDGEIARQLPAEETVEQFTEFLAETPVEKLIDLHEAGTAKFDKLEADVIESHRRHGAKVAEREALAEDRRLTEKQVELGCVEHRLKAAVRRWRTISVADHLLEAVRARYEKERQPATLIEASKYLEALTEGHYVRVWTPLAEDRLVVEDAGGQELDPALLSSGTREQLFLSLRLALVTNYAKRGIRMPIVLDDVLVNFDAGRAKAAAKVLRDFAKQGHQVLVFTCHEHVYKIFKSLKIDVRELPSRETSAATVGTTKSKAKPKSRKRVVAAPPVEPELEEEELIEEEEVLADEVDDEIEDEGEEIEDEYEDAETEDEEEAEYEEEKVDVADEEDELEDEADDEIEDAAEKEDEHDEEDVCEEEKVDEYEEEDEYETDEEEQPFDELEEPPSKAA